MRTRPDRRGSDQRMSNFRAKLDSLPKTIELSESSLWARLATALEADANTIVSAIGSGGSAVAAEFLGHCRTTLGFPPTLVSTPLDFVVEGPRTSSAVWLFSAGAHNPDIAAALETALRHPALSVHLVTTATDGAAASRALNEARCQVHVIPVFDPKDGFLATHSLVGTIAALLGASQTLSGHDGALVVRAFYDSSSQGHEKGSQLAAGLDFCSFDTLIVLHDANGKTLGALVEASLWESAICPVQRTDFRNFAHGRHVWLGKRGTRTSILAISSSETEEIWRVLDATLPDALRRSRLYLDHGGRFDVASGVIDLLYFVAELGDVAGIDPAKPGVEAFGRALYADPSLVRLAEDLTAPVRHKREELLRYDSSERRARSSLCAVGRRRGASLREARIGALLLDYDGTIVASADRYAAPPEEIIAELTRIADDGLRIAIASGRGGSLGDALRRALPGRLHATTLIGYFNGGYIVPLDVNIDEVLPEPAPEIAEFGAWLAKIELPSTVSVHSGPVQVAVRSDHEQDLRKFSKLLSSSPAARLGQIRTFRSQHSIDVVPARVSKRLVLDAIRSPLSVDACDVLRIGDSGGTGGNDWDVLATDHGISVGAVCGDVDGCWTLFGADAVGPAALLRILQALRVVEGIGRIDIHRLALA